MIHMAPALLSPQPHNLALELSWWLAQHAQSPTYARHGGEHLHSQHSGGGGGGEGQKFKIRDQGEDSVGKHTAVQTGEPEFPAPMGKSRVWSCSPVTPVLLGVRGWGGDGGSLLAGHQPSQNNNNNNKYMRALGPARDPVSRAETVHIVCMNIVSSVLHKNTHIELKIVPST